MPEPAPQPPDASSDREVDELRTRLAVAEAQLADRRRTRLGMAVRLVRAAAREPYRRRTLARDLARAVVDRTMLHQPGIGRPGGPGSHPIAAGMGAELPDGPVTRPDLRVAVILGPVMELALRYEWDQVEVGPDDWRAVLDARPPALLFVESAWNGDAGRWRLHLAEHPGPSAELRDLVGWCRDRGTPTVFWNTEDPTGYARFVETAKLFDHVCTVDADRVPAYRADLGHDRVHLLQFAAQPRIHNPVRRGPGRVHSVAFAGGYVAEGDPGSRAELDSVLDAALDFGLHIYAPMPEGESDRASSFPRRFRGHVVGSVPYEQLVAAYSSYKVFLDIAPVTSSTGSRQRFELSAAQTAVVSAPAKAPAEGPAGPDVEVVGNARESAQVLAALIRHDDYRERLALRAHRQVFDEHLYTHRVDAVLDTVGLGAGRRREPGVSAVVPTNRPEQLGAVLGFVGRQSLPSVQLVLVQHGFETPESELKARAADAGVTDLRSVTVDAQATLGHCMNAGVEAADGEFVAKMDDDNFYGRHYLRDLVRAFDYTSAEVVGKWAHLTHLEGSGATLLRFPHAEHRYTALVQGGTIVVRRATAASLRFEDVPRRVDTTFLDKVRAAGGTVYSADRFNFVSVRRADPARHTWTISEAELLAGEARLLFYGEPYFHAEV
jgi:Glycosyl transferases group 1